MSDIHIWRGTYDETGAPELRPLSDESVIRITVKQLRALCVDALGLRSMDVDALAEKAAAAPTPRDAVQAVLNELAASVEPSAKPFAQCQHSCSGRYPCPEVRLAAYRQSPPFLRWR